MKHIKPTEPITKKPKKRKAVKEYQIICSDHTNTVEKAKIKLLVEVANRK